MRILCPRFLLIFAAGSFMGACGDPSYDNDNTPPARSKIDLLTLADLDSAEPVSEGAPAFDLRITGCASGYRAELDLVRTLALYPGDNDCAVFLTGVHIDGERFAGRSLPATVGSAEVFRSPRGEEIYIAVMSSFSDPVAEGDQLRFDIATINAGDENPRLFSLSRGPSRRLQVAVGSLRVPNFRLTGFRMTGLDPGRSAFRVAFTLSCSQRLTGTGNPNTARCYKLNLADTSYALIPDTFRDHPTAAQLRAAFCRDCRRVVPERDYVRPGPGNPNGGFSTGLAAHALRTPANTAANARMLLVIASRSGYQYFNVDLNTVWREP